MFFSLSNYPIQIKLMLIILTNFAIMAAGYFFLIQPAKQTLHYLIDTYQDRQHQLLLKAGSQSKKFSRYFSIKYLRQPINNNRIINLITNLAEKNHVILTSLQPESTSKRLKTILVNKFSLVISGNFFHLLNFLKQLLQTPLIISLPDLKFTQQNPTLTLYSDIEVYHY